MRRPATSDWTAWSCRVWWRNGENVRTFTLDAYRPHMLLAEDAAQRRKRQMKRRAGITLLELLIAVTLLSVLSLAMMLSMRIGISALGRTNSKLMDNRRVAGAQRVLEQQLEGLIPVAAPCWRRGTRRRSALAMFSGQPNGLTIVSSFSLQEASRGRPQVLQFFSRPGEEGGGVRLLVNEIPYTGPLGMSQMCVGVEPAGENGARLPRFSSPSAGPRSFVLADHLRSVRFEYLAPAKKPGEPGIWTRYGHGPDWPFGIRIEMSPLEPSPARLQPVTVTAPMYINRTPGVQYEDQ